MVFRRSILHDNIIIHKFIIERDINNLHLIRYNNLYYNQNNNNIINNLNYHNKIKLYYDKKYEILKKDIFVFNLKYNKILYNYNNLNDFNLHNGYNNLIKDRIIHHDILLNDYNKYFKGDDVDDFIRIYFDVYLKIKNDYFGIRKHLL
jgi:hypothetical protein